MKPREFLRKKGVRVALLVIVAAIIVGVGTRVVNEKTGFLSNAAGAVRQPVQRASSAIVDWMEGLYGYLYEYDQLVAEIDSLRAQLAEAQEDARENAEAAEENVRLRELNNLRAKHSDFQLESSKIVSWGASNWSSTFTISKGSTSDIEMGDCVITEYGAVVGQIIELGDAWATVRTVVDTDFDCGVLVGEESIAGIVVGDYSLMRDKVLKITYLTDSNQLYEDDIVTTSGSGGVFPQGLLIGTVTELRTESGGLAYYGIVEPACNLDTLSQVFIVKDYDFVE